MSGHLVELFQEAQIAFVEQAEIVDPIAQHGQTFKAGAESKTNECFWVETHVLQHRRMDLSGAGDFQPAAFQRTAAKRNIDLGLGLGERKIRRAKPHLQIIGLEKRLHEIQIHALQISEADVGVDPQAFNLMEHR